MRILNSGFFVLAAWTMAHAGAAWGASLASRDDGVAMRAIRTTEIAGRFGGAGGAATGVTSWMSQAAEAENGPSLRIGWSGETARLARKEAKDSGDCGAAQAIATKDRAAELVAGVGDRIRALGNYEVRFAVQTDDGSAEGFYAVSGNCYYMRMGTAEIYGDGAARYEVNNRVREVTVDAVDTASRNILNNPTQAFDLAGAAFQPELLWEREGQAAVRLTPRPGQSAMSAVTLTIDTQRMRPLSLEYDFDGDRIRIDILGLQGGTAAPAVFDRAAYAGYELIDFR